MVPGKESIYQCKKWKTRSFNPCVGKVLWRRKWQPTPVFLPGKFNGQRSLAGYSLWGCKELDMTQQLSTHMYTQILSKVGQRKANILPHHLYVESNFLENDTGEFIYRSEASLTNIKSNLMVTQGETWEDVKPGAWDKYVHTTIYKIINKNLLYHTENSTQYSVVTSI